jgi:hypothetical protein
MKTKQIRSIEYWFDGMTSSYMVTKEDYYNSYLDCFPKFRLITFTDGTQITCK